jgi:arylsulfatase A-like enzyme
MSSKKQYNVILIMEDSFRKDHLGCYKNDWIITPNLDKFASESVIFDCAYAEGLPTIPARVSLFTGRYTLPFRGWQPLEQLDVPLAEILWNRDVNSAIISDTYHMHKPQFGFSRGFDYVHWIRGQELDPWTAKSAIQVDSSKYSEKNWYPSYPRQPRKIVKKQFEQSLKASAHWKDEEDHHIAQVVKAASTWLREEVSKGNRDRLFLVIDSFDPHEPWDSPNQFLELYPVPEYDDLPITWGGGEIDDWTLAEIRHIRAQYAGAVTLSDKWTGNFLNVVDELGLLDNTLIIFLSDHGEPLGEHNIIKKVKPWPYEELSHIPLIMHFPDDMNIEKNRITSFVGLPDLAPTILQFFGVNVPTTMQGKNLLPIIKGEEKGMEFGISGFNERSWSIRNHDWSYYLWIGRRIIGEKDKPELYRYNPNFVPSEPSNYERINNQAEVENLAYEESEIAASLQKNMYNFIEGLSPSPGDLMAKDYNKRLMTLRTLKT